MDLKTYFTDTEGVGVLSTADASGRVNAAIYSKPHLLDDGYASFIMLNRLTRKNLQDNPYAHYLFLEKGGGYSGVRLYLEKVKELQDDELIAQLSKRKKKSGEQEKESSRFLVSFTITKVIKLIGDKEITVE
ncbi:MAG: pyridoxamine 5'-phosphate oxidase [Deltaproteobacteria bacterium]|nr:MAG: pyridoxamine 5'-phosphate oxidase [Deltaproteobacteria bacterium]